MHFEPDDDRGKKRETRQKKKTTAVFILIVIFGVKTRRQRDDGDKETLQRHITRKQKTGQKRVQEGGGGVKGREQENKRGAAFQKMKAPSSSPPFASHLSPITKKHHPSSPQTRTNA
jgi:hypothetical protein